MISEGSCDNDAKLNFQHHNSSLQEKNTFYNIFTYKRVSLNGNNIIVNAMLL